MPRDFNWKLYELSPLNSSQFVRYFFNSLGWDWERDFLYLRTITSFASYDVSPTLSCSVVNLPLMRVDRSLTTSSSLLSSVKISFDNASNDANCRIALLSVKFVIVSSSLSLKGDEPDDSFLLAADRRAMYFGSTCRCTNGILNNYFVTFCTTFSCAQGFYHLTSSFITNWSYFQHSTSKAKFNCNRTKHTRNYMRRNGWTTRTRLASLNSHSALKKFLRFTLYMPFGHLTRSLIRKCFSFF